jgi:pyridoxal phosphate enzyme (YggS family)
MSVLENLEHITRDLPGGVTLVAVSKTKPDEMVLEAYRAGHLDFGENKVQSLIARKESALPSDIRWHFIGHLQTNKVKYIASFVFLIHGVDSLKLLKTINKEALKNERVIDCLLQIHIAQEDTKFGLTQEELFDLLDSPEFGEMNNVRIRGLMGMATFTENMAQVRKEFQFLKRIFEETKTRYFSDASDMFNQLSMGMSDDYRIALEEGSTMIRVGSRIFGPRQYA